MLSRHLEAGLSSEPKALPSKVFLDLMFLSREADRREAILFRQGRAKFQLPGAGHEAIAAFAYALERDDVIYPYYRDKALMLARGTSLEQLALDYFAKAGSTSGGRQMASHFCDAEHHMVSCATPTGMQCLPAVGSAWGIKLAGKKQIVLCCIGEAATRQGEFYEALCFALQEKLPIVFLVEDNGYGVSTPTKDLTPYNIKALSQEYFIKLDGRYPENVYEAARSCIGAAREHYQPSVIWIEVDRLMSHTSSDDQRLYRSKDDLALIRGRDPIENFALKLRGQGILNDEEWNKRKEVIKEQVLAIYEEAEKYPDPEPQSVFTHIFSDQKLKPAASSLPLDRSWSMAEAINASLHNVLEHNSHTVMLGEDICDPKGGVFGLTKGLSTKYPQRVYNAPLAEATIAGLASGLSIQGYLPIFELQFIDFVGPAFNQLVNQIATLRWRTMGRYKCPMVIFAPCGAYVGCGGPWHSQTNEAWFSHAPGLKVVMPSSAISASDAIITAAAGDDPVLILLPKNLFFKKFNTIEPISLYPEHARVRRQGENLTVVAWGNCVDIALEAAEDAKTHGIETEIVDLHYIVPTDWGTIFKSVSKTGRLLVVQEDNRTSSFGQSIIAECVAKKEIWPLLKSAPKLIAREDVHIGFHSNLENYVLPHKEDVVREILSIVSST